MICSQVHALLDVASQDFASEGTSHSQYDFSFFVNPAIRKLLIHVCYCKLKEIVPRGTVVGSSLCFLHCSPSARVTFSSQACLFAAIGEVPLDVFGKDLASSFQRGYGSIRGAAIPTSGMSRRMILVASIRVNDSPHTCGPLGFSQVMASPSASCKIDLCRHPCQLPLACSEGADLDQRSIFHIPVSLLRLSSNPIAIIARITPHPHSLGSPSTLFCTTRCPLIHPARLLHDWITPPALLLLVQRRLSPLPALVNTIVRFAKEKGMGWPVLAWMPQEELTMGWEAHLLYPNTTAIPVLLRPRHHGHPERPPSQGRRYFEDVGPVQGC